MASVEVEKSLSGTPERMRTINELEVMIRQYQSKIEQIVALAAKEEKLIYLAEETLEEYDTLAMLADEYRAMKVISGYWADSDRTKANLSSLQQHVLTHLSPGYSDEIDTAVEQISNLIDQVIGDK